MKKWQNLSAPDDPDSWYDVDGVWPTNRGSYELADSLNSGAEYTGTSAGAVTYAFRSKGVVSTVEHPEYIIDSARIWQYDVAGTPVLTDVTGAITVGARPQMAQYGSITICVMGSELGAYPGATLPGRATVYTTSPGTNFAALAGAPEGQSVCIQSNAVMITQHGRKS